MQYLQFVPVPRCSLWNGNFSVSMKKFVRELPGNSCVWGYKTPLPYPGRVGIIETIRQPSGTNTRCASSANTVAIASAFVSPGDVKPPNPYRLRRWHGRIPKTPFHCNCGNLHLLGGNVPPMTRRLFPGSISRTQSPNRPIWRRYVAQCTVKLPIQTVANRRPKPRGTFSGGFFAVSVDLKITIGFIFLTSLFYR